MDQNNNNLRQSPSSVEAEQALLGSIILKPESFDLIGGVISADDFYLPEHQHIYRAIDKMYVTSRTIDPVTLANALVEFGDRDQAGGIRYIALLADHGHSGYLRLHDPDAPGLLQPGYQCHE